MKKFNLIFINQWKGGLNGLYFDVSLIDFTVEYMSFSGEIGVVFAFMGIGFTASYQIHEPDNELIDSIIEIEKIEGGCEKKRKKTVKKRKENIKISRKDTSRKRNVKVNVTK